MKRGISLNSGRTDILNSYISDIKAVNADSQAIAGYNGTGPFRIVNNYLEGAGENVIFGGSDPAVVGPGVHGTSRCGAITSSSRSHGRTRSCGARPRSRRAGSAGGGSLPAGTHYFKVVALMDTDTRTAVSAPSNEVSGVRARRQQRQRCRGRPSRAPIGTGFIAAHRPAPSPSTSRPPLR